MCYFAAMDKLSNFLLLIFLLAYSAASEAAEQKRYPAATLIGLHMMQGDDLAWSQPGFDSSSWPLGTPNGNSAFNRIIIPEGVGWLRTPQFALPKEFQQSPVAIHIISGASFQLYWNGVLIGENGTPGTTLEQEMDGISETSFYIPPEHIKMQNNVLAVRYSAHGYKVLSLPLAFSIELKTHKLANHNRLLGYIPGFLLIGAVGAAALFFGALFVMHRADRSALWLALMFLMVTLQAGAETSRSLWALPYQGHVARILGIFIFAYGSGLFLNLYILSHFQLRSRRRIILIAMQVLALSAVPFFYLDFDVLTYTVLSIFVTFAWGITAYGTWKERQGARVLLLSLSVFLLSFLVGYTLFLDSVYYGAMALLAGTLFVLQANALRTADQQTANAKLELNRLELELLKRQIQPHFIMNTLTALSEWILTNPKASVDMIDALADEFRILNEFAGQKLVSLKSELDLCHAHLKLMSYRQDQSFLLKTEFAEKKSLIPPSIFHTLIENALTHSRYHRKKTVFFFSQRTTELGAMEYILITPRPASKRKIDADEKGRGIGLAYVKARLKDVWGDDYSFKDGEDEQGGWRTVILLPRETLV